MRAALCILLAAVPVAGGDLLEKSHLWRGSLEIRAEAGGDVQVESLRFVLVTEPPRRSIGKVRLDFAMRESSGDYRLVVDHTEPRPEAQVAVKGAGEGRLHPRVGGWIDPETGDVRLAVRVEPETILAHTTLSGIQDGRLETWRTVTTRAPLAAGFLAEGRLSESRVVSGERRWEDTVGSRDRTIVAVWRLERIEPAVRGIVTDHTGRPVAAARVVARTTNPERVRKRLPPVVLEGRTDVAGRFSLPAFPATWILEIPGEARDGAVVSNASPRAVVVRPDESPDVEVEVDVYLLARLPDPGLLSGHFRGDVAGFLGYLRERHPERRFRAALAP